jgi:hypothetical protein
MRKRKLWWVAGVVLLAVTVASVLLIRPVSPLRIAREDFNRIRRGMNYEEVEAIMGCPPGNYTTGETDVAKTALDWDDSEDVDASANEGEHSVYFGDWCTDTASLSVVLDASGKVIYRAYLPIRKVSDNPAYNLLWRAKHQGWRPARGWRVRP